MAGIVNKVYLAEWKAVIHFIGTKNNDFHKKNCCSGFMRLFVAGGGGAPYDGLYGEAPQERVTFFRFQVCKG